MPRSPRRMRLNQLRSSIAAAIERLEGRVLLSTYTVSNLNDSGPGSLRDAIQQANANPGADTVDFAPGLSGTVTLTSGSLNISGDLDLVGPGAGVISVSGMNAYTVFEVGGGSVEMSGLTITGGYTNNALTGGGITNHGNLTLEACALTHNQGLTAGAIQNASFGALHVTNCTVSQNSALSQAAIYDDRGSTTIANSTFSGNTGTMGSGVIDEEFGTMTILDSTISGNTNGEGIKDGEGSLTVMNTTISGCTVDGIKNYCSVHFNLVNCTITGNKVGVNDYEGLATITNCTITGNSLGLEADSEVADETRISLLNAIIAKNDNDIALFEQGGDIGGFNNLIGTGESGGLVNRQNGNIVGVDDPMLAPLGNYGGPTQTMPPLGSSLAIDAGSNAVAVGPDGMPLTTDQRGYNRIFNGTVDIGADEFGFAPASQVVTNLNDSGPGSLRQAVLDANINHGPDTITFAPGLRGTITLTSGQVTSTDDSTTITGPGASVLAVSGGVLLSAFGGAMHGPALDISGLTIDRVSGDGFNTQLTLADCTVGSVDTLGSAVIRRCTISGLTARGIGEFDVSDSTIRGVDFPTVGSTAFGSFTNCTITGSSGDGIYSYDEGTTITLTRCTVSGNGGSGIHTEDGFIDVIDSTISGNGGSGIAGTDQPSLTVSGSTIVNNRAGGITYRGAMAGGLSLINSTVANNMGGGINAGGFLTVTNSTIVGNVGTVGGIAIGYTAHVNNTIVAGNRDAHGAASDISAPGPQITFTGSNNLIGTGGSGGLVNGQNGNIVGVADPKLAPLGDYGGPTQTMPPLAGSPAIDAGSNALAVDANGKPLISDQRGYYRIVNGRVDIGSVEFNSTPLIPGDANGDGKVDFNDLLILARHYGTTTGATWSEGDFTGDGAVTFDDMLILARNFGRTRLRH